jgi:cell division ATPase FtsA
MQHQCSYELRIHLGWLNSKIQLLEDSQCVWEGETMRACLLANDLAKVLNLSDDQAQWLLWNHGTFQVSAVDHSISIVEENMESASKEISKRELAEILEARMEEIFFDCQRQINNLSNETCRQPLDLKQVALYGKCTGIPGIVEIAQRILGAPEIMIYPDES